MFTSFLKKTFLLTGGLIALILLLSLWLNWLNQDKVILGTIVADSPYGGLNSDQAEQKLGQSISDYLSSPVEIVIEQKKLSLQPSSLGLSLDPRPALQVLKNNGHTGSWPEKTGLQLKSLFLKKEIELTLVVDQKKLHAFLSDLAAKESQPQDAQIKINPKTKVAYLEPSRIGKVFDREVLLRSILTNPPRLLPTKVNLRLIDKNPIVDSRQATTALWLTNRIISLVPVTFRFNQETWSYDANDIFGWLDFRIVNQEDYKKLQALWTKFTSPMTENETNNDSKIKFIFPDLNEDAITTTLAQLAPTINREPSNARLQVNENNEVVATQVSQAGQKLNIDASLKIVKKVLFEGARNINLTVVEVKPRIDSRSLANLGLVSLLATGVSDFSGSPVNRRYNIKTGAAKFDGILLQAEKEFSFNGLLGSVDAASGYLPELVIKDNRTIPEYGGGLCQVSTTLFRAAVNAGLPITERTPHAYPVAYYNPQGFDSTIYPPHPDLRFKNDTPNNLLLQSYIKGNKIFFEIFGTADGRETRLKGPFVLEANPDGSMKTILTQEVWKNEKLVRMQTFFSNYKSPALYHKIEKNPLE